jgi:hypothetical protein
MFSSESRNGPEHLGEHPLIGDPIEFQRQLTERAESSDETGEQILGRIEQWLQGHDRIVEAYADPALQTFCCREVPPDARDPQRKRTFLIGVPQRCLRAPEKALRGWIWHELGHAIVTDFARQQRIAERATQEGFPAQAILQLDNCIEDGRMERLVGGPVNRHQRTDLFEKNRLMMIPVIGGQLAGELSFTGNPEQPLQRTGKPMQKGAQFNMLAKLHALWNLHAKDLGNAPFPEKYFQGVDADVLAAFRRVEPTINRITGSSEAPPMKNNAEVERTLMNVLWPELKQLLQKDQDEKKDEQDQEQDGEGNSGQGQGPEPEDEGNNQEKNGGGEKGEKQEPADQSEETRSKLRQALDPDAKPDEEEGEPDEKQEGSQSGRKGEAESDRKKGNEGTGESGEEQSEEKGEGAGGEKSRQENAEDREKSQGNAGQPSGGDPDSGKPQESPAPAPGAEPYRSATEGDPSAFSSYQGPEGKNLDPRHPESWPEDMRKAAEQLLEKHIQRQQQRAKEKQSNQLQLFQQTSTAPTYTPDAPTGNENAEYTRLAQSSLPITRKLKTAFERYLPRRETMETEYGRRGVRFNVQRLISRYRTGIEKPLGRREQKEEKAMILQVIIDVSGSMYSRPERIMNAVRTCVALCEAGKDYNIDIEILASDEGNVDTDESYKIKAFDEDLTIDVKNRLAAMIRSFGGNNRDAESVKAALPRILERKRKLEGELGRTGALMLFVTDSTTKSDELQKAVSVARERVPVEGIAITSEAGIGNQLRYHFGPDSRVPEKVEDFPDAFADIIRKYASRLR